MSPKSRSRSSGSITSGAAVRRRWRARSRARGRDRCVTMRAMPSGREPRRQLLGLPPAALRERRRRTLDDAGRVELGLAVTDDEDRHAAGRLPTAGGAASRRRRGGSCRASGTTRPSRHCSVSSPVSRSRRKSCLGLVVADDVHRRGRAAVLDLELGGVEIEAVAGVLGLDRARDQIAVAVDGEVVEA